MQSDQKRSMARAHAHPHHARFDRIVEELEAHPRAHIACVFRGLPGDTEAITQRFGQRMGVAPGPDVLSFYTARDGCALIWLANDDPRFSPESHARDDAFPSYDRIDSLAAESLHIIALAPIERALGDDALDYARDYHERGDDLDRYSRSFWAFDFPGDYYTPALVVDRGRVAVQVGDDHGVFDDGRPTVTFDDYVHAVLATRGSIRWRAELFGFRATEPRFEEARQSPRAWLDKNPVSIDDLLPPPPAALAKAAAVARAREDALPADPRLRALIEVIESARSVRYEEQKDGRTLVRVERADGGRQLTFLRPDERASVEGALSARRALGAPPERA